MRHRYLCPLRWADLDQLGHVNNVRYVDYLQEARGSLLRSLLAAAGVEREEGDGYVVVRHEVTFLAPLMFRGDAVVIESWVTEIRAASFTLDHEIFHELPDGDRRVYARARTVLAPYLHHTLEPRRITDLERQALAPYAAEGPRSRPVRVDVPQERADHYPVQVRFSDIDVYRHVNNVVYFEYFQEARIALFGRLREAMKGFPRFAAVIAQADVEYVAPMHLRADPYDCWTVVSRMGTKSMVFESELVDASGGGSRADGVLARSRVVIVFFDRETQRSAAPPAGYREAIAEALGASLTTPLAAP